MAPRIEASRSANAPNTRRTRPRRAPSSGAGVRATPPARPSAPHPPPRLELSRPAGCRLQGCLQGGHRLLPQGGRQCGARGVGVSAATMRRHRRALVQGYQLPGQSVQIGQHGSGLVPGGGGGGLPPRRGRQVGMSAPPPPPAAPLGRNARRGGHDARGRRRLAHHATPSPPPRSGTSVATSREVGTPRGHIPCLLISLLGRRMIAVRVSQTERLDAHPLQPRPNPTPSLSQYRRTSWARKKARSTPERWAGLSPPPAASDAAAAAAVVATTRSASPAGARARPTWWEGRAGGA